MAMYIKRPRDPKRTSEKEYMADPKNFQFDEQVTFATKIKDKDMIENWIILDLDTKEVIKARFDHEKPEQVYEYFYSAYKDNIDQFLESTMKQQAKMLEELTK